MDFFKYLMQMIKVLAPHMAKFQHYNKGAQTDNVVELMASFDYCTQDALQLAQVASLFESSKKSKRWATELCMKFYPAL
jgi:hypothetical protein